MDQQDRPNFNFLGKTVTVIGVGNIGSALIGQLRDPLVRRVIIIDPDIYEHNNLLSQDIQPDNVGKPKAIVQAERLRRINPSLEVTPIVARVENVPLGRLRGDVILTCLDSRQARRVAAQAAWRLGIACIDAGVSTTAGGAIARVSVYLPGSEAPCIECAWSQDDYAALEQVHPCDRRGVASAPTGAPLALGALAAALLMLECRKLLAGDMDHVAAGKQVLIDALNHSYYVTSFRKNPHCRFDHQTWDIQQATGPCDRLTVGQTLELAAESVGTEGPSWLRVEGQPFTGRMQCLDCGHKRATVRLRGRLTDADRKCEKCDLEMVPVGFDMSDQLDVTPYANGFRTLTLSSLGFQSGDVLTIGSEAGPEAHLEIKGD